jgi:glucokinase
MKNSLDTTGFTTLSIDIGGTNVRFGVGNHGSDPSSRPRITNQMVYPCESFDSIDVAMETYRKHIGVPLPEFACMAVAGPVKNNIVRMTNRDWLISGSELTNRFGFEKLIILNDAAAIAYATRVISAAEFKTIKSGRPLFEAPAAVITAGTGIGVATIVPFGDHWHPLASEAGHVSLAAQNAKEAAIFERIKKGSIAISAEVLLSGEGIRRLYFALAALDGVIVDEVTSEEITQRALNDEDKICVEALEIYCNLLGTFAGDIALTVGARGGIYLAGNVLRQVEPLLYKSTQFRESFENKGAMQPFLSDIPVNVITLEEPGLVGASAWLSHSISARSRDIK